MRYRFAALVILTIASLAPAAGYAQRNRVRPHARPQTVRAVFRLKVAGHVNRGATFWVAYGPLGGSFGIIKMHRTAGQVYEAARTLPAAGKTTYAFVEGQGSMHSRMGIVPGNPVITIRQIGPTTLWPHPVPMITWHPAVG